MKNGKEIRGINHIRQIDFELGPQVSINDHELMHIAIMWLE